MSVPGVHFLVNWIDENVPVMAGSGAIVRALGDKLRADAANAGLRITDMNSRTGVLRSLFSRP